MEQFSANPLVQSNVALMDAPALPIQQPSAEERLRLVHAMKQASSLMTVRHVGCVAQMTLPAGFESGQRLVGISGNSLFQSYNLSSDPQVKIYFEYRGHRISQAGASAFAGILSQKAHVLKNHEIALLKETLQEKSDSGVFKLLVAKTEDLNGKRVLIVEGRYPKDDLTAYTLYIDMDGTGSAIQEITFQTKSGQYAKRLLAGMNALKSIRWKDQD